jgi:signal transduction histidine kinase/streptogramin lyase
MRVGAALPLLFSVLLTGQGSWASAQVVRLVPVGDQRSIPDGVVTALAADPRGFLWIGTTQALVRFDGYEFRHYLPGEGGRGPGGSLVRSLHLDREGRLWIGFDRALVNLFDPATELFRGFRLGPLEDPRFAGASVMGLARDGAGRVYAATRGAGLAIVDPESGAVKVLGRGGAGPAAEDLVHTVELDADGRVWIGSDAGLSRLGDEGRMEPVWRPLDDGRADPVYRLRADGARLWVGTLAGRLAVIEGGIPRLVEEPAPERIGLRDTIYDLLVLRETGELWLARASGLEIRALADGGLLRRIEPDPGRAAGLRAPDVRALARDAGGLVWVGGFGGGVQWHDPRAAAWLAVVDRMEGAAAARLDDPNVGAILALSDGRILFGLRGGGLVLTDGALRLLAHFPGREDGMLRPWHWTTALAEDAEGRVFVGTRDGVYLWPRVGRGSPEPLVAEGGAALGRYVRRLFMASDGRLWIGTGHGAFSLVRSGEGFRVERVAVEPGGILGGEVNAFVEEPDGTIWLGAGAGLFRGLPPEPLRRIPVAGGFPVVVGLLRDPQGVLWVDTNEGLFRSDGKGGFERLAPPGIPAGGAFGANLLMDREGRLWSHRFVFDPRLGRGEVLPADLELDFGTGWFRAYAALADGRFLFGGSRGVLMIDPSRYRPPAPLAAPLATQIVAGGLEHPAAGSVRLLPRGRALTVRFASPDVRRAERLRYRYRLAGMEEEWTEVDARQRLASYRSLPPGRYVFEAAAGERGEWSEPLRIEVEVLPQWWERPVVRLAGALLVLLLVAWAWRQRTRALRRRAEELERRVGERTAELSAAKDRAEEALAELRRAQNHLVQAEKMASLGRMVAGLAHEINTPLGVALTAVTRLEEVQRERFRSLEEGRLRRADLIDWKADSEEGSRLLQGSLERAARLVQSLKRVAVDQSAEQRRRFVLAELLEELRITFTPRFKRSPHRLLIDCEPGLELDGFPGALFQVLSNLLENAERHAFREGQAGTVRILARREEASLRLELADDGAGMAPEVAARAFEPFFTTRREDGGSGLGLHLVYNLVHGRLGGRVELETAPGRGCRFLIRLPLSAPSGEGVDAPAV